MNPSEVLLPYAMQGSSLGNLLTSNWRDNGAREDNDLSKQLMALIMCAGYAYFGSELVADGENQVVGATSMVYAASGLLGYFGMGNMPIISFSRVNFISVIMSVLGVFGLIGGVFSFPLAAITVMHMFDVVQGISNREESRTEYLNQGS